VKFPFSAKANDFTRWFLIFLTVALLATAAFATVYHHVPLFTQVGKQTVQPLPFSHQHHVQGLGLDCRYCHTSVEKSASAGYPDTATCYGCHSQIWTQAAMLQPVRDSAQHNKPLTWFRVNQLPDYVYFNHSIHIAKGIGCVSCHGEVSRMAVVVPHRTFLMRDCLSCHEAPEKYVRPREEIFNEKWVAENQQEVGERLVHEYGIQSPLLTNCSVCHR